MRTLPRLRAFAVSLLLVVASVAAARAQRHAPPPDAQIEREVADRLLQEQIAGVEVTVTRGTASLRGTVKSLWEKQTAVQQALRVDSVMMVDDDLTIARGESDRRIAEQVTAGLRRCVFFTIFDDADAEVDDGIVTLTGRVTASAKVDACADMIARVAGVQQIRNKVETLPAAHFDEHLRYAAARQIYGNAAFQDRADRTDAPIHVIVERGRVTLTGVVRTEAERRTAGALAEASGALSVTNRLRIERQPSTWE